MEKCKYCQAELEEGSTICPSCGKDNAETEAVPAAEPIPAAETAPAEETVPEETVPEETVSEETIPAAEPAKEAQPAEIKEGAKATPGKVAIAVVAVVVLLAVLIALLVSGLGASSDTEPTETVAAPTETQETVPATVPADGNPDDETCKGTYTASDAEVIAAADTVVATAGEYQLTNAQLQIYYWLEVQNFLGNYGAYAPYFGLDYTQPLDTQVCAMAESGTWQQFFLASALQSWQNYQGLSADAEQAGFELAQEFWDYLDTLPESMEENAINGGFADAKELLVYNVGPGAALEDYYRFMELYYQGYMYFDEMCGKFTPTLEEMEAYYAEHEDAYTESGMSKDMGDYVDVRHILVCPVGGTTDENGTTTYSDEEWAACEAAAQEILDAWLAGDRTEDSFAALANEKSEDPGSNTDGGLYTDVTVGQMVEPFENWCFDESRQTGDYGLVKTDYGYHVMYFVNSTPIWQSYVESDMVSERANTLLDEVAEKYPLTVDYESILLGYIDLGA